MRAAGGFSKWHAYIYADGVVTNLNSLIPAGSGLHLTCGTAINNAGQIVGMAFDAQGRHHAYLLTPLTPGTPVVSIGDAIDHRRTCGHPHGQPHGDTFRRSQPAGHGLFRHRRRHARGLRLPVGLGSADLRARRYE